MATVHNQILGAIAHVPSLNGRKVQLASADHAATDHQVLFRTIAKSAPGFVRWMTGPIPYPTRPRLIDGTGNGSRHKSSAQDMGSGPKPLC